jgi:hypothetical protein
VRPLLFFFSGILPKKFYLPIHRFVDPLVPNLKKDIYFVSKTFHSQLQQQHQKKLLGQLVKSIHRNKSNATNFEDIPLNLKNLRNYLELDIDRSYNFHCLKIMLQLHHRKDH